MGAYEYQVAPEDISYDFHWSSGPGPTKDGNLRIFAGVLNANGLYDISLADTKGKISCTNCTCISSDFTPTTDTNYVKVKIIVDVSEAIKKGQKYSVFFSLMGWK